MRFRGPQALRDRVEKPWVANQGVMKSKELTSWALTYLTLSNIHEVSRVARP